ncbi:MAG: cell division protein FtsA, partial [Halothiobacillus sp. 28-55-5]
MAIRKGERDLVVGLDVGTTKVAALVGEYDADGHLSLIGFGQSATNKGLRRGSVVDIESTSLAIQRAIDAAGAMSNCEIGSVWVGVAGDHVISMDSKGMTGTAGREITAADIHQVVQSARAVKIPDGQQILYCEAQEFRIDGQDGIRKPQGMTGHRLEADVHIVTTAINNVQNIVKCVERCGLSVTGTVLDPIAAATAVLNEDEKELGVCLVDIGGGTTDIAVFKQGAIRHTAVVPIAGDQMTNDVAVAFRTPTQAAEEIKIKHGCALRQLAEPREMVEVPGVDGREPRQLSVQTLAEVIEPRVVELYEFVLSELRRSGMEEMIASGIVITGGSSMMRGMVELG